MLEGTTLYVIAACVVGAIVLLAVVACKSGCCGAGGTSGNSGNTSRNAAAKPRQQYQQLPRVASNVNPALLEEGKLQQMTPLRSTATSSTQTALSTSSAQLRSTRSEDTVREEPEHSPLPSPVSNPLAPPSPPSAPSPPAAAAPQDSPHRMALHRSDLSAGVFEKLTASTRKLLEDAEMEFGSFDPADLEQHEPIAQGSQATVFAGTLHHKDYRGQITKVAIKAYSGLALTNKQMTRDLMAELNALKRLNDFKHILHFYGIVISDNQLKTVLEWCQGTIDKLTEGHALHQKIHLLAQAASAVHYLHSQRPPVLHGDIKPENILVSENFQVRVGDFATSRILDNARPSAKDSRFRGTPVYLPPEMFNLNEMGLEGDIYAFGVTAWEVLTEQKAWQDMKMGRIMLAVSEGQRPEVSMLPTQLQLFLADTWAQEPKDRLSSWSLWTRSLRLAVLSALDNAILLGGQPGRLRLMQLRGADEDSATAAEQCILVSVDAAVAQRGVQPDVPRFLSSLLGFFSGEERASIDRSSQIERSLTELFGIVFV